MKNILMKFSLISVTVVAVAWGLSACKGEKDNKKEKTEIKSDDPVPAKSSKYDKVKEGERLVKILGCHDCHSPKVMTAEGPKVDPDRLMSGHPASLPLPEYDKSYVKPGKWSLFVQGETAMVGPWGISYASNLTPSEVGIGAWTVENFRLAMREGKAKGMVEGRQMLPPMPWQGYKELTEEELEAIFSYLMSLKAIDNVVPPAVIAMKN